MRHDTLWVDDTWRAPGLPRDLRNDVTAIHAMALSTPEAEWALLRPGVKAIVRKWWIARAARTVIQD